MLSVVASIHQNLGKETDSLEKESLHKEEEEAEDHEA